MPPPSPPLRSPSCAPRVGPARVVETGVVLARHVRVARGFWERLQGALPDPPAEHEALLITRCSWVHSFGMRGAIDVVYLDSDLRVLRVVSPLLPWRVAPPSWGAWAALELPPGSAANLRRGHQLVVDNLDLQSPPRAARRSAISP